MSRITDFLATDLGRDCIKAYRNGRLVREQAFTLKTSVPGPEGESPEILVQGVIDCYFEDNDGITLIDYKTGYVDHSKSWENEAQRIKEKYEYQIKLYAEALEKALKKKVSRAVLFVTQANDIVEIEL